MAEVNDDGLPPPLVELLNLDEERRLELITRISSEGFSPGCWLRLGEDRIITPQQAARFVAEQLPGVSPLPRPDEPVPEYEGELPWDPPTDGDPAWLIVSQPCDLVRDIADEPFVQVVPLRYLQDGDLKSLGRRSSRLVPIDPTGEQSRCVADLRVHALVAKSDLLEADVRQAIPPDSESKMRPRSRFPLRVGQRFSRDGVPTRLVDDLVAPLTKFIEKREGMKKKLDGAFVEFLLIEDVNDAGQHALIGVVDIDDPEGNNDFIEAEEHFHEFLGKLPSDLADQLDEDASKVQALNEVNLKDWLDAWRIDLDFVTFGSKGDSESPTPQI